MQFNCPATGRDADLKECGGWHDLHMRDRLTGSDVPGICGACKKANKCPYEWIAKAGKLTQAIKDKIQPVIVLEKIRDRFLLSLEDRQALDERTGFIEGAASSSKPAKSGRQVSRGTSIKRGERLAPTGLDFDQTDYADVVAKKRNKDTPGRAGSAQESAQGKRGSTRETRRSDAHQRAPLGLRENPCWSAQSA